MGIKRAGRGAVMEIMEVAMEMEMDDRWCSPFDASRNKKKRATKPRNNL